MKVTTTKEITITLVLNEEEAQWLQGIMQNPLFGEYPDQEDPKNSDMRKRFWDALNEPNPFGVKPKVNSNPFI